MHIFVLLSLVLTTFAGSWVETSKQLYFFLGVGTNSENAYYASAGDNGVGFIFLLSQNGGYNWSVVAKDFELMTIGCGSVGENDAVMTGVMGKAEYTLWGGYAWKESVGFVPACQSVVHGRANPDMYGAASGDGIAVSHDKGQTFIHHRPHSGENATRYGAVPSENTWYVTAGLWAEDENEEENNEDLIKQFFPQLLNTNSLINIYQHHFNQRLTLLYEQHSKSFAWKKKLLNNHKHYSQKHQRNLKQVDEGIWGEIWKTADGGESWNRIYRNEGSFYFNAIDCCDVNTCYAVAEGDSDAGSSSPGARILMTTNGGVNWNIVYWNTVDGSSLMSVHCLSDNEAWAAGGMLVSDFDFHGLFYHTTNGGKNWTSTQMSAPVLFMDMSNDGKGGIATGLTLASQGVSYGYKP